MNNQSYPKLETLLTHLHYKYAFSRTLFIMNKALIKIVLLTIGQNCLLYFNDVFSFLLFMTCFIMIIQIYIYF